MARWRNSKLARSIAVRGGGKGAAGRMLTWPVAPLETLTPMAFTVDRVDLRILRLPLVRFFETSFGRSHDRQFVLVTLHGEGLTAWGECVADAHPFYSAETTATAWLVLRDYLVPAVFGRRFEHPREVWAAVRRVRGHRMAKAALEMAAWEMHAKALGEPLWRVLGGTRPAIASGVSVGIQDSVPQLLDVIEGELAAGYRRIKIKIKPGWDVGAVEAVRQRFGDVPLMVDANAAYTLADGDHLAGLDRFGLMMIEQPLDYEDVRDHAALARRIATPICLDESVDSVGRAEEAIALGACRIVNIKPGRVGGFTQSVQLHDLCAAHAIPVWHGGMLESGIGRAQNVHLASLPNFSLPGDIAASRRYYRPDLVEPPIEVGPDGTIPVPHTPGTGVEVVEERVERATEEWLTLTP